MQMWDLLLIGWSLTLIIPIELTTYLMGVRSFLYEYMFSMLKFRMPFNDFEEVVKTSKNHLVTTTPSSMGLCQDVLVLA